MKKVGVVGIGDMGSGLAKNLLKAGFEVCGFDPTAKRLEAFAQAGGMAVASPLCSNARHATAPMSESSNPCKTCSCSFDDQDVAITRPSRLTSTAPARSAEAWTSLSKRSASAAPRPRPSRSACPSDDRDS